jgi:hypothetical protein
MTETIAVRAFLMLLALAGLSVVCSGWRAYGRDAFRQRAFALRDELFDYAAAGNVEFNDPAYWRLRLMMNTVIQYSHRLTFGEAILPLLIAMIRRHSLKPGPHHRAWMHALSKKPKDVRDTLTSFDDRFHSLATWHLMVYTPLAWPLLIVVAVMTGNLKIQMHIAKNAHTIEEDAIRDLGVEEFFNATPTAA